MNHFGGKWTKEKIEAFMEYVNAYLVIMNKYPQFKLLYFDGFAGSGGIVPIKNGRFLPVSETKEFIKGVASHILSISKPRPFDVYCFIEKDVDNAKELKSLIEKDFPDRSQSAQVVIGDCNEKLEVVASFLRKPREKPFRALLFIDPYGMQLSWETITLLKGLQVDMWILVPTGIAIGRLLKRDGAIRPALMNRLVSFLGMSQEAIMDYFYTRNSYESQLGARYYYKKRPHATARIGELYRQRIAETAIFRHVSDPMLLKNSRKVILYHFIMCTNNLAALNIANSIANKQR